jgi:hypothetical protein
MTIPAGRVSRTRCFVHEASGTDALRIALEEIARSAKVIIRISHGAAGRAGIGDLLAGSGVIFTATAMQQTATRAGIRGTALFRLRAISRRAGVVAAMPLEAAGRYRKRNHRKHDKNRAFHVRRFLFVRNGSLNFAGDIGLCLTAALSGLSSGSLFPGAFSRVFTSANMGIALSLKIEIGGRTVTVQKIGKTRVFHKNRKLKRLCICI